MKPKFKVGDKVVIKNQKSGLEFLNCVEGTVEYTYVDIMNCRWYRVKTKQGVYERTARELDFAEVSPKNTPKFKIGDTVKNHLLDEGQVVGIRPEEQVTFYEVKPHGYNIIEVYPEHFLTLVPNKQTTSRSLSITLEQAKFYYEQGGTLREIALRVFTEEELNPKPKYPRSWEELCKQVEHNKNIYRDDLAEKLNNYHKLLRFRDAWIHIWSQEQGLKEDWEPDWSCKQNYTKWCIEDSSEGSSVIPYKNVYHIFTFPTMKMANEFLSCFDYLLKKAKGLY